ncbi:MAG TPA: universal stress protein [Rhizomicrobium sp.]|nr:universal stress protein [Rhizomicrobium sp.]
MTIARIVVPVTGSAGDDAALATAFHAAKPFGAHVEVLFVHRDPREAIPYSEMPLSPDIVQQIVDREQERRDAASNAARRGFDAAAAALDIRVVDKVQRGPSASASYVEITGHLGTVMATASLLADLVVLPPIAGSDGPEIHDAFVRVLTKTGRPVLLAPERPPRHLGRRIAIGWDGRSAAANALLAALPLLDKAEAVEILSVQNIPSQDRSIDDARDYLALHGIGCSERLIDAGKRQIADVLLDATRSNDCDLLVAGGYGHSRLVESIFGGVTQSIVSHPTLPIFMVH